MTYESLVPEEEPVPNMEFPSWKKYEADTTEDSQDIQRNKEKWENDDFSCSDDV